MELEVYYQMVHRNKYRHPTICGMVHKNIMSSIDNAAAAPAPAGASSQEPSPRRAKEIFGDCALVEIIHLHDCFRGALKNLEVDVSELCREMSTPTTRSWKRLKRVARYLLQYPVLSYRFERQCSQPVVEVFVDSDHAGCRESRKSTTGFALMHGRHCLKTGSSTQTTIAMSSGEAELYAVVRGASEGLGLQALADDLGVTRAVRIWTDSAAAKGMVSRTGAGRQRHLEVKYLWVQQACREERFAVRNVAGERNPADLLTKPLSGEVVGRWLRGLACDRVGRDVVISALGPRGSVTNPPP